MWFPFMNRAAGHQAWITMRLRYPVGYEAVFGLGQIDGAGKHTDEVVCKTPGRPDGESVAEMRLLEALGVGGYQQIGTIAPPLKEPADILAAQFVPLVVV